jgi:hypothetical protein
MYVAQLHLAAIRNDVELPGDLRRQAEGAAAHWATPKPSQIVVYVSRRLPNVSIAAPFVADVSAARLDRAQLKPRSCVILRAA